MKSKYNFFNVINQLSENDKLELSSLLREYFPNYTCNIKKEDDKDAYI